MIGLQVVQETLKERVLPAHIFCAGMVSLMAKGEQYKVWSVCVSISAPFLTSTSLSIDDPSTPGSVLSGIQTSLVGFIYNDPVASSILHSLSRCEGGPFCKFFITFIITF